MDMNIDQEKVKTLRIRRAWSQDQLAAASGLSLRTIQRIEKTGIAANESVQALAAVLDTTVEALRVVLPKPKARWMRLPLRVGSGFMAGAAAGVLLTSGGSAAAIDFTVRTFLDRQLIAEQNEAQADLRGVTVSLVDTQSRERARVRIRASKLDDGTVLFDLVLYSCDSNGCKQVGSPAVQTRFGVPAKVEWSDDDGPVLGYEFVPRR